VIASRIATEPIVWLSSYAFFTVFLAKVLGLVLEASQGFDWSRHTVSCDVRQHL
jgi:hypothetical protein